MLLSSNLQMDRRKCEHQEFLEWLDLFIFISFAVFFALQVSYGLFCSEVILYVQEDMTSVDAEKCGGVSVQLPVSGVTQTLLQL